MRLEVVLFFVFFRVRRSLCVYLFRVEGLGWIKGNLEDNMFEVLGIFVYLLGVGFLFLGLMG